MNANHTPTPWFENPMADGRGWTDVDLFSPQVPVPPGQIESSKEVATANRAFICRAVNSHEALLDFAKKHHEFCQECEGTGRIYNNADPTSGQWVPCPYAEAIAQAEGVKP